VTLAYDVVGDGEPPLLFMPAWASHLSYDWETPEIRRFYRRLAQRRAVVRYDKRGTGLSARSVGPDAYRIETQVADALAVLDAAGIERTAVWCWSNSSPTGIALAAHHPDRVSHLIVYGGYARAARAEDYPSGRPPQDQQALLAVVDAEWGLASRMLADFMIPEADQARVAWFVQYQRAATTPEVAKGYLEYAYRSDVRSLLPTIATPTLVLHRRNDHVVAAAHGHYLAEHVPGAQLRVLDGEHHLPYFGDPDAVVAAVDGFLAAAGEPDEPLTSRELEVLRLLADGRSNRQIAAQLTVSPATVARHVANIFRKLGVNTRASAAAWAFRRGMV